LANVRGFLAAVTLALAGCASSTGVTVNRSGAAPVRLDAGSTALPSGAVDFRISAMDTLTVDVHRNGEGAELADFGDAIQVAFALKEDIYRVAPGDALGLTLQSESPQEFTLIVRPDGYMTLPRIGEEIEVAGKTRAAVQELAMAKFAASSRRPQLAVQLIRSIDDHLTRLGATYEVSRDGKILIPTLGAVTVRGLTAEQIAQQIQLVAQSVEHNSITVSAVITVAPANATVMQSPDVRRYYHETVKVSADGSVFVPNAGRFDAAGKTLAELTTEVTNKLATRYRNGLDVYIGLGESASLAVYVMGEVKQPGKQAYQPAMTMLQLLAAAGWVSDAGDLTRVKLIHRTGPGTVTVYTVNLQEVYSDKARGFQDLRLSPSDMVMVPRTGIANADLAVDNYIRKLLPFNTSVNYSFVSGHQVNVN
jgi:protein involved in polysaccharide export with SLBB domain